MNMKHTNISMRFSGKVMKEFIDDVYKASLKKNWYEAEYKLFDIIRPKDSLGVQVPFLPLALPVEWLYKNWDPCVKSINRDTGEWSFSFTTCYIEEFNDLFYNILPFIIEQVMICEVWKEETYTYVYGSVERQSNIIKYNLHNNKWYEISTNQNSFQRNNWRRAR